MTDEKFCYLPEVIDGLSDILAGSPLGEWRCEEMGLLVSPHLERGVFDEFAGNYLCLILREDVEARKRKSEDIKNIKKKAKDLKEVLEHALDSGGKEGGELLRKLEGDKGWDYYEWQAFVGQLGDIEEQLQNRPGRPPKVAIISFLRDLALTWKSEVGEWPSLTWDPYEERRSRSFEDFLEFARAAHPFPALKNRDTPGIPAPEVLVTENAAMEAVREAKQVYS